MKKKNFVLTVKFNNGTTSELFNLNGLKETTVEHATNLAYDMVKKKIIENSKYGKRHSKYWFDAQPHSMRYDLVDSNGYYKGREVYTF